MSETTAQKLAKRSAKSAPQKKQVNSVRPKDLLEAEPVKLCRNATTYTPEVAKIICNQLSDGIPLKEICRQEGMPAWRTIYDWMRKDAELSTAIARARDIGYDALAEECLYIADNVKLGQKQVMGDDGTTVTIEDMLGHRRLQIETRLKLLAKFNPKKYGEKLALAGDADNPVKIEAVGEAQGLLEALLLNVELKKQV
jgi:hypothetical protein